MKTIKQNPPLSYNSIKPYLKRKGKNLLSISQEWLRYALEIQSGVGDVFIIILKIPKDKKFKGWKINDYYSKGDGIN